MPRRRGGTDRRVRAKPIAGINFAIKLIAVSARPYCASALFGLNKAPQSFRNPPIRSLAASHHGVLKNHRLARCDSSPPQIGNAIKKAGFNPAFLGRQCAGRSCRCSWPGFTNPAQAPKKLFSLSVQPSSLGECLAPPVLIDSSSSLSSLRWCSVSLTGVSTVMWQYRSPG